MVWQDLGNTDACFSVQRKGPVLFSEFDRNSITFLRNFDEKNIEHFLLLAPVGSLFSLNINMSVLTEVTGIFGSLDKVSGKKSTQSSLTSRKRVQCSGFSVAV